MPHSIDANHLKAELRGVLRRKDAIATSGTGFNLPPGSLHKVEASVAGSLELDASTDADDPVTRLCTLLRHRAPALIDECTCQFAWPWLKCVETLPYPATSSVHRCKQWCLPGREPRGTSVSTSIGSAIRCTQRGARPGSGDLASRALAVSSRRYVATRHRVNRHRAPIGDEAMVHREDQRPAVFMGLQSQRRRVRREAPRSG
jgi:hypothetical protein